MRFRVAVVAAGLIAALITAPRDVGAERTGLFLQAPASQAAGCSVNWTGRESELEAFLLNTKVAKVEDVPIGVTKPRRAVFEPGGLIARAAWKPLPPSYRSGFHESYKAEVAAYALDRLLQLGMVPPAVERRHDGNLGAMIQWIENTKMWDNDKPPKGPEPGWSREISKMKLFDQLIANIDRNAGNILYDADWHIILIDHSRAFIDRKDLRGSAAPVLVYRPLWTRIEALTPEQYTTALSPMLTKREIESLLLRRDRMREAIAKMVKSKGEAGVFIQ